MIDFLLFAIAKQVITSTGRNLEKFRSLSIPDRLLLTMILSIYTDGNSASDLGQFLEKVFYLEAYRGFGTSPSIVTNNKCTKTKLDLYTKYFKQI